MLRRVSLLAALAALLLSNQGLAEEQQERACRPFEMRLARLLGSGRADGAEGRSVRSMLRMRGCSGASVSRAAPRRSVKSPGLAAAPAAVVKQAPRRVRRSAAKPTVAATRSSAAAGTKGKLKPRRKGTVPPAASQTNADLAGMSTAGGTFRTLCVRTCDGYYFPISYSTTRDHFKADQATCQQMCPAAEAGLYYHDVRKGGPEDMLSVDGTPYRKLPAAFIYRTSLDQSCTCTRANTGSTVASLPDGGSDGDRNRIALPPVPRPSPGEDPETLANRLGDFVAGSEHRSWLGELGPDAEQGVRVVLPDWQSPQSQLMLSPVPGY